MLIKKNPFEEQLKLYQERYGFLGHHLCNRRSMKF
jgi:hypothetical protein